MMHKLLIFLSLGLSIFLNKGSWVYETCNSDIAKLAVPPVIWYEQAIDGSAQSHMITRMLHNKPGIFMNQFGKCYFQNIEPYTLYKTIGFIGMIAVFYLFYKSIDKKNYLLLTLLAVVPILPFFGLPTISQILLYKLISFLGLFLFIKNIDAKK